ncbi:MAG TPA: TolC family protein, partial [Bacteroidetes bacterium]|nr:TolC family protein [Bacteroidota bacterium]
MPDLTAQSTGRYSKSENNNPFNYITAVTNDNTYKSRSVSQVLDLGWTLFNGFRVHAQKSKFGLIQQQSLGNEQLVMENTVQAIILSYYRVKVEEEKLDVLGQLLQLSGDRYKRSAQKKKIGAKTTFEFLQDKNIYLTDSTNWISQKLVRKNALRSFNMLMAVSDEKSWELTDKLIYNEPDWKYNALLDSMRSNNYNLKNQYLNLEVLKKDMNIQRSQLYPRINFGLGLNYGDQKFENAMGVGGGSSIDYY